MDREKIAINIIIVSVLLILGLFISNKISEKHNDFKEMMNKSVKVESPELFKYSLDTDVGDIMAYGELKALNPVSSPNLDGEWLSIEEVKEVYTRHVRYVTRSNGNGGTTTDVVVYYTWDVKDRKTKESKDVEFCGVKFPYNKFTFYEKDYITTVQTSSSVRYKYYGIKSKTKGTIISNISKHTIKDNTMFYNNQKINDVIEFESVNAVGILFWLIWLSAIGYIIYRYNTDEFY